MKIRTAAGCEIHVDDMGLFRAYKDNQEVASALTMEGVIEKAKRAQVVMKKKLNLPVLVLDDEGQITQNVITGISRTNSEITLRDSIQRLGRVEIVPACDEGVEFIQKYRQVWTEFKRLEEALEKVSIGTSRGYGRIEIEVWEKKIEKLEAEYVAKKAALLMPEEGEGQ